MLELGGCHCHRVPAGHLSGSGYGSDAAGSLTVPCRERNVLLKLIVRLEGLLLVPHPPFISFFILFIFNAWEVK